METASYCGTDLRVVVPDFLRATRDVYGVARCIQDAGDEAGTPSLSDRHPLAGHDLDQLRRRLTDVVARLDADASEQHLAVIADACRKVGLSLLLRLERFTEPLSDTHLFLSDVTKERMRPLWPAKDVDALGLRLDELTLLWKDALPGRE